MFDQNEKFNEILYSDKLDTTLVMNILINAVRVNWNQFSKVDQFLIGKSLQTIQEYAGKGEDMIIKFDDKWKK